MVASVLGIVGGRVFIVSLKLKEYQDEWQSFGSGHCSEPSVCSGLLVSGRFRAFSQHPTYLSNSSIITLLDPVPPSEWWFGLGSKWTMPQPWLPADYVWKRVMVSAAVQDICQPWGVVGCGSASFLVHQQMGQICLQDARLNGICSRCTDGNMGSVLPDVCLSFTDATNLTTKDQGCGHSSHLHESRLVSEPISILFQLWTYTLLLVPWLWWPACWNPSSKRQG